MTSYNTLDELKLAIDNYIKANGDREITGDQLNGILKGLTSFITGASGLSSYQLAVKNGFQGSEIAWLASLIGPTGSKGADGAQGIKGDKGDPGNSYTVVDNLTTITNGTVLDGKQGKILDDKISNIPGPYSKSITFTAIQATGTTFSLNISAINFMQATLDIAPLDSFLDYTLHDNGDGTSTMTLLRSIVVGWDYKLIINCNGTQL